MSYFAITLINPSDVVTIMHTSVVITAFLSRFFLKEKLTFGHLVASILSSIGVILITKPNFIFDKTPQIQPKNSSLFLSQNSTEAISQQTSDQNVFYLGIGLSFLTAVILSFLYIIIKKLWNAKVHWAVNTIYISWFGIPSSFLTSFILIKLEKFHMNFDQEKFDLPYDILIAISISLISLIGQVMVSLSLKYEDASKMALVKTIDVFFAAVLQYFLLNILMDVLSVFGASSIVFGTIFVFLFQILEAKYLSYKQASKKSNRYKRKSFLNSFLRIVFGRI